MIPGGREDQFIGIVERREIGRSAEGSRVDGQFLRRFLGHFAGKIEPEAGFAQYADDEHNSCQIAQRIEKTAAAALRVIISHGAKIYKG